MPGYVPVHPILGSGPFNDILTPDTTQRWPLGMVCDAVDPYFGWGRFVYLKPPASATLAPGALLYISDQTFQTTLVPNTANTGFPVVVARSAFASSASAQYGWFQMQGMTPLKATNSIATGVAFGMAGAGSIGTLANGKQLLNATCLQAATYAITKTGTTLNGSAVIKVPNIDGLFIGMATSGTGVASGTVSTLDPGGTQFVNSGNSTATATVTVTFTYTGFILAHLQNAFVQGQVA